MRTSCACSSCQRSCRCGSAASKQCRVPLPAAITILLQAQALPALLAAAAWLSTKNVSLGPKMLESSCVCHL